MKSSHGHDNSIVNGIGRIGFMKEAKVPDGLMRTWQILFWCVLKNLLN